MRRRALSRSGRQRGIAAPLFAAGTVAMIAMVGLALDLGIAYQAKTRLQNALDTAALDGAKTLNQTFNTAQATSAAAATFATGMGTYGEGLTPVIETSATLNPFSPGSANPRFLRVRLAGLPSAVRLASVLPGVGSTLSIEGSAVAGPLPVAHICGAFPVVLCGTATDPDCSDYSCFGITGSATSEVEFTNGTHEEIGPGNFGFVEYGDCSGSECLRDAMAGGSNFCFSVGGNVVTEPGVSAGPARQGMNTRFGIYNGPVSRSEYPPDVITSHNPVIYFSEGPGSYQSRLGDPAGWDEPSGVPQRRVVPVPFIDCSTPINGRQSVEVVGSACFFLTRPLSAAGHDSIYGQLLTDCPASGSVSPTPGPGEGPYKIVLYQDPDNPRDT